MKEGNKKNKINNSGSKHSSKIYARIIAIEAFT